MCDEEIKHKAESVERAMSQVRVKRERSEEDDSDSVVSKKSKISANDENSNNEMDYAQTLSTSDVLNETTKTISQFYRTTNDINRLNRERGLAIVKMASKFDALVDSASRSPAANMQRNQIWTTITEDINKCFPMLPGLQFEQCKKLCKYYKRKDPSNYGFTSLDNVKQTYRPLQRFAHSPVNPLNEPISTEALRTNDILNDMCGLDRSGSPKPASVIVHEESEPNPALRNFISEIDASTSNEGLISNPQIPSVNQLKKDRAMFVCQQADFHDVYDSNSRSFHVNAERNEMWKKITATTNEKFAKELGELSIEQTKKLYANYKRKCPILQNKILKGDEKANTGSVSSCSSSVASYESVYSKGNSGDHLTNGFVENRMKNGHRENGCVNSENYENLTLSMLVKMLYDRDEEIRSLKREVNTMNLNFKTRIKEVYLQLTNMASELIDADSSRLPSDRCSNLRNNMVREKPTNGRPNSNVA